MIGRVRATIVISLAVLSVGMSISVVTLRYISRHMAIGDVPDGMRVASSRTMGP